MIPKVSVIIPVYNVERYLRECLDSVINQTLKEIEIICVNDGSTDSSLDILNEYEKTDSRFFVVSQPNINAGSARNNGLKYAHGEYYSFLDSDDFFELDMLEKAYVNAKKYDADIVVFRSNQYLNNRQEFRAMEYSVDKELLPTDKIVFSGTDVEKNLFGAFIGWPWDKLFRAQFVADNRLTFQEQRSTNDLEFVYSAIAVAKRIVTVDDLLAHYRIGEETSISSTREKSWFCFYCALLALRAKLIEFDLFNRFEQDYINYCVKAILWNYASLAEPIKSVLLYMLSNGWVDQLGICKFERDYFYDYHEYDELMTILFNFKGEKANLTNIYLLEIEKLKLENSLLQQSIEYKVGKMFTWIPQKVKSFFRYLGHYGAKATAMHIITTFKNH